MVSLVIALSVVAPLVSLFISLKPGRKGDQSSDAVSLVASLQPGLRKVNDSSTEAGAMNLVCIHRNPSLVGQGHSVST